MKAPHPFHKPDQAPVADPGLTKNRDSNSKASKLSDASACAPQLGIRRDSPMGTACHQNVDIHLSC